MYRPLALSDNSTAQGPVVQRVDIALPRPFYKCHLKSPKYLSANSFKLKCQKNSKYLENLSKHHF